MTGNVATLKGRASADLINFRPSKLHKFKARGYRKKWLLLIIRRRRMKSNPSLGQGKARSDKV